MRKFCVHRHVKVLRLDHRWRVYRATCGDAGYEKLECLRAPGDKTRRAWHAPDGAGGGERHHRVGLTRDCRAASGNKTEGAWWSRRLGSCSMWEGCSRRCSANGVLHDWKNGKQQMLTPP